MTPEVGHVYARRRSGKAEVMRVVSLAGEWAEFRFLHGPVRSMRAETGRCKVKNFAAAGWRPTEERPDYAHLDGATRFATFRVLATDGAPILRCSAKRAAFYVRKGYAREVEPGVLQFLDPRTEDRLRELYLGSFTAFFMAVKNDLCVCCGTKGDLKRHKRNVPQPWRSCLSNVLFVCGACHRAYEAAPEPDLKPGEDWRGYVNAWRDHFRAVLNPRFLPTGWDIVSVQNFDAL